MRSSDANLYKRFMYLKFSCKYMLLYLNVYYRLFKNWRLFLPDIFFGTHVPLRHRVLTKMFKHQAFHIRWFLFMTHRKSWNVQTTHRCNAPNVVRGRSSVTDTFNSVFDHCYGFTTAKIRPTYARNASRHCNWRRYVSSKISRNVLHLCDNYKSLQL